MINTTSVSKNISSEILKELQDAFDRDPAVIKLRIDQDMALRVRNNPREAMMIGKKINDLFSSVISNYCAKCEEEALALKESVTLADRGATEEQSREIFILCIALFMMCDMTESAIMEAKSKLKKIDGELDFGMFMGVKSSMAILKDKLKYLTEHTQMRDDERWGIECDKMYEVLKNKAGKLVRLSESKSWKGDSSKENNLDLDK